MQDIPFFFVDVGHSCLLLWSTFFFVDVGHILLLVNYSPTSRQPLASHIVEIWTVSVHLVLSDIGSPRERLGYFCKLFKSRTANQEESA